MSRRIKSVTETDKMIEKIEHILIGMSGALSGMKAGLFHGGQPDIEIITELQADIDKIESLLIVGEQDGN